MFASIASLAKARRNVVEIVSLAVILIITSYLRLVELELGQYRPDDITLWNLVHSTLLQPRILTSGMEASFGLSNGPFQAYLLLPGAWLASGHIGAYVTVAVLNIIGVVVFWAFVRSYWDAKVALLAALLCATNPWAVIFSRRLWGNDMVPPFTTLVIWSLCDLVKFGRRRDSLLPFLWLAIVIQIYVVALIHLALAVVGFGLGLRRVSLLQFLGGLILFIVLIGPYLLGTVLPNFANINTLLGTADKKPVVDLTSMSFMFHIVSSDGYQAFANQMGGMLDATSGMPYVAGLVTEVLLGIGLMVGIVEAFRHCRQRAFGKAVPYLLPLIAVLLPPLMLVRHTSDVYPFYLVTGFPMHFLFVALGIPWVGKAVQRVLNQPQVSFAPLGAYVTAAIVVLVVGTHLILGQVFFTAIQGFWAKSAYGIPLRYVLEIADTTKKLVKENGYSRVYLGGTEDHDSIMYRALRPDMPSIFPFDTKETLVKPDASIGKVLYILSSSEDRVGKQFNEKLKDREIDRIDLPGGGSRISFFAVDAADLERLFSDTPGNQVAVTFDNRVRLDSYIVNSELHPGEPAELMLRWSMIGDGAMPDYYAYVRLVDQTNKVRGGANFHDAAPWRSGEQLIWWRDLPTPKDLEPGVYSYIVGLSSADATRPYRNAVPTDPKGVNLGDGARFGMSVVRSKIAVDPPQRLSVNFGDKASLEGYGLAGKSNNEDVTPGTTLDVDLYWKALDKMDLDYTVFVHFFGPDGKILAQHDSQPANRSYPTIFWQAGDAIVDRHSLQIPSGLAPGQYNLRVGLYDLATGQRLGGADRAAVFPLTVK